MIEGLFEAHLPVSNVDRSIEFYQKLGLELAWKGKGTAFFWTEKHKSWLGLWEGDAYKTPYHPSLRHIAFRVSYEKLKHSLDLLRSLGIDPLPFGSHDYVDPFIRPYQGNGSVYFKDPDGNSLELMCFIEVPDVLKGVKEHLSFEEWETTLSNLFEETCCGTKEL